MRIGIVNDLDLAVRVLKQALRQVPDYQIAWIAGNGVQAVDLCKKDTPDLVLMDLIMPIMDGVEATRLIMKSSPCAILVVTSTVTGHSAKVFEAMGAGALDVVATPVDDRSGGERGARDLLAKIRRISKLIGTAWSGPEQMTEGTIRTRRARKDEWLVAIGCSTGGPKILVQILSVLPENFPAAVVVIQHMDEKFTPGLIEWLDRQTPMPVRTAFHGSSPQQGMIHFACTDNHLVLTPANTFRYTREPVKNFYHPSVDVFFNSIAQHWPGNIIGVLLTGMGRDGAKGLLNLYNQGWHTIVQDRNSSVVYGMPKAAVELGAAGQVLPAGKIGPALASLLPPEKGRRHG
ncbi:MAG: chemotaxis response regulator protein-glutamate methylesterase [Desulfobacterales bacterium]|nr:chemotaxis response regulator protein-glutamate methylesterase [Desulfobacterales bacterium]